MNKRTIFLFLVSIYVSVFVRLPPLWAEAGASLDDLDFIAPSIQHAPFKTAASAASALEIRATITDNVKVQAGFLFYRPAGNEGFLKIKMNDQGNGLYSAVIPRETVFEPRMEYYFEATDTSGNAISKGSSSSPLSVSVVAAIPPPVNTPKAGIDSPLHQTGKPIPATPPPTSLTPLPTQERSREKNVFIETQNPASLRQTKADMKKPWYKKWWVWTIVAGVAIGASTASGGGGSGGGDVPQPTNTGSVTIDSGPP